VAQNSGPLPVFAHIFKTLAGDLYLYDFFGIFQKRFVPKQLSHSFSLITQNKVFYSNVCSTSMCFAVLRIRDDVAISNKSKLQ